MRLRHPKTTVHPFPLAHAGDAAASHAEDPAMRLRAYWHAYAVTDEETLAALSQRTMQRVQNRIIARDEIDDLPFSAVVEAQRLLEEWLVETAGYSPVDAGPQDRAALRLALLSGCLPDWPQRLLAGGRQPDAIGQILRSNRIQPVPPQAELVMPTQVIGLRSLRLGARRLWEFVRTGLFRRPLRGSN